MWSNNSFVSYSHKEKKMFLHQYEINLGYINIDGGKMNPII